MERTTSVLPGAEAPAGVVRGRDVFSGEELAVVLSHFDLGVVESVVEFPRGSRKAPKVLVAAEQGKFLLKRRAKGRDDPYKVAFCHAIQLHLAQRQFPLPHLIGTRRENNSMLQVRGNVYELFEYIPGTGYPQSVEATADAGRVLGLFHKLLAEFESPWQASTGSYHGSVAVEQGLKIVPTALSGGAAAEDAAAGAVPGGAEARPAGEGTNTPTPAVGPEDLRALAAEVLKRYRNARKEVDGLGLSGWPGQIVHADWHPGNMLFRDNHVVAVIDYDSARLLPRIVDVANGALQFSIIGGGGDVSGWPRHLDETRFREFVKAYDQMQLLTQAELKAMPGLMIEALIAEAVLPIATTGTFGRVEGLAFLQMVRRKAEWIEANAARLVTLAGG